MSDPKHDTQPVRRVDPRSLPPAPSVPPNPSGKPKAKRSDGYVALPPTTLPEMQPYRQAPPTRGGGCLIPAWSILLTLIFVFACAFGILAAAVSLGGDAAPGGDPQIVVIPPQTTPTSPLLDFLTTPTPTLFSDLDAASAQATFALEGPMLAPVIFTPTPMGISVSVMVSVDVDGGLNIRPQPGVDNTELYRANYGEIYNVIAGPENVNGLTWWRLEDPTNPSRGGWAAGEYLLVVSSP